MLKKTMEKLHETFEAFSNDVKEVLQSSETLEEGDIKVVIENGDVTITGPLKQLVINGKRVRFTTTRSEYHEDPPK